MNRIIGFVQHSFYTLYAGPPGLSTLLYGENTVQFLTTAANVLVLMAFAVPGFLFVKTKSLSSAHIPPFSKLLLYACQPCLQLYAFQTADCTPELLGNMGLFFLVCTVVQLLMMLVMALFLRLRPKDACRRVCAASGVFGNVGFLGIPLLEALLPEETVASAIALAAAFSLSMNLIAWTGGLFLLTGERKHIRARALLLNPSMLSFYVAFPLFLFGIRLPAIALDSVTLMGRMCTPLCMLILGMRLACTPFRQIVTDRYAWCACAGKLIVMPLFAFASVAFLPLPYYFRATLFLLCCCPTASAVQSLSEISLPEGEVSAKRTAADAILLSNLLCILTIPLLCSLLQG